MMQVCRALLRQISTQNTSTPEEIITFDQFFPKSRLHANIYSSSAQTLAVPTITTQEATQSWLLYSRGLTIRVTLHFYYHNYYRIAGFCREDFNVASDGIRNIKIRYIFYLVTFY